MMATNNQGGKDASHDRTTSSSSGTPDVRSYSERTAARLSAQSRADGVLGLAKMATVETGDPYLDQMAHAVAIDYLRRND